jgi:hypothetical protein
MGLDNSTKILKHLSTIMSHLPLTSTSLPPGSITLLDPSTSVNTTPRPDLFFTISSSPACIKSPIIALGENIGERDPRVALFPWFHRIGQGFHRDILLASELSLLF